MWFCWKPEEIFWVLSFALFRSSPSFEIWRTLSGSVWTCQQWIQQPHCWLFKCFQYFYKSCLWSVRAWTLMALIWLLAMSLSCNFNFEIKDKKCEESNALGLFPFFFNQFLFFLFCSALLNQIRQLRSSRGFPLSFPHHNKVLQS